MNKICYLQYVLIFVSYISMDTCQSQNLAVTRLETKPDLIRQTYFEVDSLLRLDNGRLWGHQLYGPIMMVDPSTRIFIANRNSANQDFKKINGLFTDSLPSNMNIANTALDWLGERWTMVILPLPEDEAQRSRLVIHELFHRIQPEIGFGNLPESDNGHLDTYQGRVLLRLEMEALKAALATEDIGSRRDHLMAGLTFRGIRQSDLGKKQAENTLELNEGLAEYTAIALGGGSDKDTRAKLVGDIEQFYWNPTYVRSFAYHTIPVYGFLLAKQQPDWQKKITSDTDLTNFFKKAFDVVTNMDANFGKLAEQQGYDLNGIVREEQTRESSRLAKIAEYKTKFLEGPTLILTFENMNISFDPRNIVPIENIGTVYPNLRVTDNWGILKVENGALLSADWSYIIVSGPYTINERNVEGDGWQLELALGWELDTQNGNSQLKRSK